MLRAYLISLIATSMLAPTVSAESPLRGKYVEARTCQVYTGPCFANGEVGSAGKDAIMTWKIERGELAGVQLADLGVAVVVKSSHTLGFNGLDDAQTTQALLILDEAATPDQAAALKSFALAQTGLREDQLRGIQSASFEMQFDAGQLTATVTVGDFARLQTRKARPGDCICSNESAYYPPLTGLQGFVPGVTIDGEVKARRLGTRWSIPNTRTAYLGTFEYDVTTLQLAKKS
jgi:hypothetical protein